MLIWHCENGTVAVFLGQMQVKPCSILFSELQDFTVFSNPDQRNNCLNIYLSRLSLGLVIIPTMTFKCIDLISTKTAKSWLINQLVH